MEKSITAILIRSEERKDNDYLIRLFSGEGIITAIMRGVRKPNAKLKFAAQPFAFCVYELAGKDIPVVTGAISIEDFSLLAHSVLDFSACSIMLECADYASVAVDCSELFVSLLKCLKSVAYGDCDSRIAAIKFMQKILFMSGFFRPVKDKREITDEKSLIDFIAAEYLDNLSAIKPEDSLTNSAVNLVVSQFERTFDCKINSAGLFK